MYCIAVSLPHIHLTTSWLSAANARTDQLKPIGGSHQSWQT